MHIVLSAAYLISRDRKTRTAQSYQFGGLEICPFECCVCFGVALEGSISIQSLFTANIVLNLRESTQLLLTMTI